MPYEVSDHGNVRRTDNHRPVAQRIHKSRNGEYMKVDLWQRNRRKTFRVHRLVAQVFVANPEYKPEVNHKNCDTKDNHAANLEWMTRLEQEQWKAFCRACQEVEEKYAAVG
jgi:hypothetical protein